MSAVVSILDLHKATGSDGLSTRFIRISPYMVRLITVLLNKCIDSSLFPYHWKQAILSLQCQSASGALDFYSFNVFLSYLFCLKF